MLRNSCYGSISFPSDARCVLNQCLKEKGVAMVSLVGPSDSRIDQCVVGAGRAGLIGVGLLLSVWGANMVE